VEAARCSRQRHEVPTHLNIEDKAFAGLTMRQLMVAIIGLALAYSAMSDAPLPLTVRLAAGATVLLMTAASSPAPDPPRRPGNRQSPIGNRQ
jgi:hypothetical protein